VVPADSEPRDEELRVLLKLCLGVDGEGLDGLLPIVVAGRGGKAAVDTLEGEHGGKGEVRHDEAEEVVDVHGGWRSDD